MVPAIAPAVFRSLVAVTQTVKANAVINWAALGTLTLGPCASAGSIPGTISVPVPMMKLPKHKTSSRGFIWSGVTFWLRCRAPGRDRKC